MFTLTVFLISLTNSAMLSIIFNKNELSINLDALILNSLSNFIIINLFISYFLLMLGFFDIKTLFIANVCFFLLLFLYVVFKTDRKYFSSLKSINFNSSFNVEVYLILSVSVLVYFFSDKSYFYLASHLDAGNYQLYGDYFTRNGSFNDYSLIQDNSINSFFINNRNNWHVEDWIMKPSYFLMFPTYLSLFKIFLNGIADTWLPLMIIYHLFLYHFFSIVHKISKDRKKRFLYCLIISTTPLYFIYSKMIMSEILAAFLVTYGLKLYFDK